MKFKKDKRGVFGLNAVQSFFAIILGIALLAYVIVIIMGTLTSTTIIPLTTSKALNESVTFTDQNTAQDLSVFSLHGVSCSLIDSVTNATNVGTSVAVANFTLTSDCTIINATKVLGYEPTNVVNLSNTQYVSYTYVSNSQFTNELNGILGNTSTGISGFFNSINPVYAILAVLVIILVLVVLVRVVQAPNSRENSPQL